MSNTTNNAPALDLDGLEALAKAAHAVDNGRWVWSAGADDAPDSVAFIIATDPDTVLALIAMARRTADAEEEQAVLEEQRDVAWLQRDHAEAAETDATRALGEAAQREFALREALTAFINETISTTATRDMWWCHSDACVGMLDTALTRDKLVHAPGCPMPAAEAALKGGE